MEAGTSKTPPLETSKQPSDREWTLNRVTGPSLDPSKFWYVISKQMCGSRPTEFAKNEVFKRFPSEIACVNTCELKSASVGCYFNRQPKTTYVATSFGLCSGLMRQREISSKGYVSSPEFRKVVFALNSVQLEDDVPAKIQNGAMYLGHSLGYLSIREENSKLLIELKEKKEKIDALEHNLKELNSKIANLKDGYLSQQSPLSLNTPDGDNPGIDDIKHSQLGSTTKKRKVISICKKVVADLDDVCERYHESLGCVLGNYFIYGKDDNKESVRNNVSEILDLVVEASSSKKGLSDLLLPKTYQCILDSMRVPDWVLLYFKLQTKLPDSAWQTLLNLTKLGRGGRQTDTPVLLTKNDIKAVKSLVFSIVRKTFEVKKMETNFPASNVNLNAVLVWAIREQCIYTEHLRDVEFNIKLDGRPLGGKNQVAIGVVPINFCHKSSESALSVYPIAIGNCKEDRNNLVQLIQTLNAQKNVIKRHGIKVDGKTYQVKFTVTIDYKALLLLLRKKDDDKYVLGGKGYGTEFCAFCDAIRACTQHGADIDETCVDCLRSKANIGRSVGLRDDLMFLLEEDLSHINLCSLHCEMRNCEQLLGSIGLFAYRIGGLEELNAALADYGPETSRQVSRVTVKENPGQQTAITRQNIKVASFSGGTERAILKNFEDIIKHALPIEKVTNYYKGAPGAAHQVILNYITFFEERKKYLDAIIKNGTFVRDYGDKQEEIEIDQSGEFYKFLKDLEKKWITKQKEVASKFSEISKSAQPRKKKKMKNAGCQLDDSLSMFAAELQVSFFVKVCTDWRELAITLRETVFEDEDEELIDIHEIKCKEWGFLLKELFGIHLGTGDYGHLVVDHSAMLLRQFRSLYKYSGQGFESSHKLHRQLFSKATNHDASGPGQSSQKTFSYRGCGRKGKLNAQWSEEKAKWIKAIDSLFTDILGSDFLKYRYHKDKGTCVTEEIVPKLLIYHHDLWEKYFQDQQKFPLESTNHGNKRARVSRKKLQVDDVESPHTTQPQPQPQPQPQAKDKMQTKVKNPSDVTYMCVDDAPEVLARCSDSTDQQYSKGRALHDAILQCKTRAEFAATHSMLPPVQNVISSCFKEINGNFSESDPFSLPSRPCATVIMEAEKLMRSKHATGVCINVAEKFSDQGLSILKKFCQISETSKKVSAEYNWLVLVGCTSDEMALITNALWRSPPNRPLVRFGNKSIDVLSFSDLVDERYIDNFTIDVCIGKFLRQSNNATTMYLPSEFHTWMGINDKDFQRMRLQEQALLVGDILHLTQILVPVHMTKHWGLIYIDLVHSCLYFDDGMKISPPGTCIPFVKQALDILSEMFPGATYLQNKFWRYTNTFHRFGMPSQVSSSSQSIGTGSCGVGVILSARDFIYHGPNACNNIKWKYFEMRTHRKNLMLSILNWCSV